MATRLMFPRGATRSFNLVFSEDSAPIDLTGATLKAYLYATVDDVGVVANALATLSLTVVDAAQGKAKLTFTAANTSTLAWFGPFYWQASALLADGRTIVSEQHQGPVILTPLPPTFNLSVFGDDSDAVSTIDSSSISAEAINMANVITNRYSLTALTGGTATCLDGITTASGAVAVGSVVLLSINNIPQMWMLKSGTTAGDCLTVVRPADYNASTNPRYWQLLA